MWWCLLLIILSILVLTGIISMAVFLTRRKKEDTENMENKEKPKLIWSCPTQLGNALRTLSSCAILAEQSNKQLVLAADLRPDVKICLEHFFNLDYPWIDLSSIDNVIRIDKWSREIQWFQGKFKDYGTTCDLHEEASLDLSNTTSNIYISTIYALRSNNLTTEQFKQARKTWYQQHLKAEFILAAQAEIRSYQSPIIGVHIRYQDNLTDTAKCRLGNTSMSQFNQRLVQELIEHHNQVKFLICTDNPSLVRSNLEPVLSPHIAYPSRLNCPYKQAGWEMLLLSATQRIIGSVHSTFSYEAAYMASNTSIQLTLYDPISQTWHTHLI